jgi:deoxycytidylate deaminase
MEEESRGTSNQTDGHAGGPDNIRDYYGVVSIDGRSDTGDRVGVGHLVEQFASVATCQKRKLVCVLYDENGHILSIGTANCVPPQGICARLQTVQTKDKYTGNECNSTHAEINALAQLPENIEIAKAEVYGHDFACIPCEKALHKRGVWDIRIIPEGFGTGLVRKG